MLDPVQFYKEISFENVSFSYPDGRKALNNVSFKIAAGEIVAIVGNNGAGKSTLMKLLLRFYDPTEGTIKVDGRDLKTVCVKQWRSFISGVFQDYGEYHFTVEENIKLSDLHASEKSVSRAALQGGFTSVLPKLHEG